MVLAKAVGFLLALGSLGCSAKLTPRTSPPDAGHDPGSNAPPWVPPLTAAQRALLDDGAETPVQVPVGRVFPDLTRFDYAANGRMEDPSESLKFTRMVSVVVTESPHFYVITDAPAGVENLVAQYGPPSETEPDSWQKTVREPDGSGRLLKVQIDLEAQADYDRGKAAGEGAAAIEAFKAALAKSPETAALKIALAEALAKSGDEAGAKDAYEGALAIDPTISTAHAGLAEIYEARGDRRRSREEATEALAYYPRSRRAKAIAERLTNGGASVGRVRPYSVFIDVTSVGAVRVAANGGVPGQMYASCRAVMRYEPDVRAALFERAGDPPYFLSVVEEIICLEAAIGAYLFTQDGPADERGPRDPRVEELFELAHTEGLLGYAMFEILGQHRPERARAAPPDVHAAMVGYIKRHVLGEGEALPDGVYKARADLPSVGGWASR